MITRRSFLSALACLPFVGKYANAALAEGDNGPRLVPAPREVRKVGHEPRTDPIWWQRYRISQSLFSHHPDCDFVNHRCWCDAITETPETFAALKANGVPVWFYPADR